MTGEFESANIRLETATKSSIYLTYKEIYMASSSQDVKQMVEQDRPRDDETPILTPDDIINLPNPFQKFSNDAELVKNRNALNELTPENKRTLATKMLLECPGDELNYFGKIIEAARIPADDTNSFHEMLAQGFSVTKHIKSLFDLKNFKPFQLFVGSNFNADNYNEFNELKNSLLKGKEFEIAVRLAITTPQEKRDELSKNIRIISPSLSAEVQSAFLIQHHIELHLEGDLKLLNGKPHRPEQFFLDRDFNADTYNKFHMLFETELLKNKEQDLANKIVANVTDPRQLSKICKRCEALTTSATDGNNFFKLLNAAISAAVEQKANDTPIEDPMPPEPSSSSSSTGTTAGGHPDGIFGKTAQPGSPKADPNSASEAANRSENSTTCCGWFN